MSYSQDKSNGYHTLMQSLKNKQLNSLYFFYGDETYLLTASIERIKKQIIDPFTESFNYHKLTNEKFEMRAFSDAVENLPMMAEHSMVVVEDVDIFKFSEHDRDALIEILNDIPEYCTVVFTYIAIPWKRDGRLKKLCEVIEKKGETVEFAKQEQRDLIPWIARHFASSQKKIAKDLCEYLIDITGGTMTALIGEINKISAYSGAEIIVKEDIDAVVEPILDVVVFQMTEMLAAGSYSLALQKLQQLLKKQEEPIAILGAIGGQFRRLSAAVTLMSHGQGANELTSLCGISQYAARKTMNAARNMRPEYCAKAAEFIIEADHQMKISFDDKNRILEMVILALAQEAVHG